MLVYSYSIVQRISSTINQTSSGVAITDSPGYEDNDANLPIYNGRSPAEYNGGDGTNIAVYDSNTVNVATEMSFVIWPEYDITQGTNAMFIKVNTLRTLPSTGYTCILEKTQTSLTCYIFPSSGWILIYNYPSLTAHTEYTFRITGLTNPKHRIPQNAIEIVMVQNGKLETEYIMFTQSIDLDLGAVD